MSDFKPFASLVQARFAQMSKQELYVTVDGDLLWDKYLQSFPEGTNPIYKIRTEYDCNCCRNFMRNLGNVVVVVDGRLQSIWGVKDAAYPFNVVAAALDAFVLSKPITDLFRSSEHSYGAEQTRQLLEGQVINWSHFHGKVGAKHFTTQPDKARGDYRIAVQVFQRGLQELSPLAIAQVLELIDCNAIYRGAEHRDAVQDFRKAQNNYRCLPEGSIDRELYVWTNAVGQAARFRNTVIGTLVQDLSEGVDMERAVHSFEKKVDSTNYKRTTALVTPSMVKAAMKTITELGLEPALERRLATIGDVSVNNVLWVDNSIKPLMKGGIEGLLMSAVALDTSMVSNKAVDISIADFMTNVVPKAQGMDLLVQGKHLPNLVTLTAPVYPDSGRLFKWNNDFGWSYRGNVTDSIKEKVKAAGGNVTNAKLRVSLEWYNFDDLDLGCIMPNGRHIWFANKLSVLDVDMNACKGTTREPVENLSWGIPANGEYKVYVNQYSRRETVDVGFTLEVEFDGVTTQYTYNKGVIGMVLALTITIKDDSIVIVRANPDLSQKAKSKVEWGVNTETFVKVQTLMNSPNYWDENAVGNKHWIFMLDGCINPEPTRGIYNEFLNSKLDEHRKVFEVLGDRTKCKVTDTQLSGMGFSSTRQDVVTVRVHGAASVKKTYNVRF